MTRDRERPDIAGTAGYTAIYSNDTGFVGGTTTFGCSRIVLPGGPAATEFETRLEGPFDPTLGVDEWGRRRRAQVTLNMRVVSIEGQDAVRITVGDRSEDVPVGERSGFFNATFPLGVIPPRTVSGIVRFEVKR